MTAKVLLLLALVAAAIAEDQSHESSYESYESEEPKYEYSYKVKDYYGNDFGHGETRDGDRTEGTYYNHLPDGRLQTVKYYVDGYSGYVADVSYEGEAHYDSGSYEHYRPSHGSGSDESNGFYRPRHGSGSDESDESRFKSRESRFSLGSSKSRESQEDSRESSSSSTYAYEVPFLDGYRPQIVYNPSYNNAK